MNKIRKITFFSLCFLATTLNGLHANEALQIFREFCKNDHRFSVHLAPHHDLPTKRYGLRHSVFLHHVILISYFRDFNVGISIAAMDPQIKYKTHISISGFQNEAKIADLIILVNPEEDFVSAFFSIQRELILGRKFLERIQVGDVNTQTSLEEFAELFKKDYKITIENIKNDFQEYFKEWIATEGLLNDADEWLKSEIENISKKNDELPIEWKKQFEHQIDILYEIIPQVVYLNK